MPLTSAIRSYYYCYAILVGKIRKCLPVVLSSEGSDDDDVDVINGMVASDWYYRDQS